MLFVCLFPSFFPLPIPLLFLWASGPVGLLVPPAMDTDRCKDNHDKVWALSQPRSLCWPPPLSAAAAAAVTSVPGVRVLKNSTKTVTCPTAMPQLLLFSRAVFCESIEGSRFISEGKRKGIQCLLGLGTYLSTLEHTEPLFHWQSWFRVKAVDYDAVLLQFPLV